jgi:excinuclease ABC subunit C
MNKEIKNQIQKLPKKPGVYVFRNKDKKIIYIGKALSLKNRVSSYFQKGNKYEKAVAIANATTTIDHFQVNSEFEALVLEAKLIKEHKPKFNSQHRDDKRYLYIAVFKTPFPHINIVRRPDLEEKICKWFGPFPSSTVARQIMQYLRRVFPYCSCSTLPKRKCFYSHIGLCPGADKLNSKEHLQNIQNIVKFLSGKTHKVTKNLEKKMKTYSDKLEFEKANKVKRQLASISYITHSWKNTPKKKQEATRTLKQLKDVLIKYQNFDPMVISKIEGYDISNLGKDIIVASMVSFLNTEPEKSNYRKFRIKNQGQDDQKAIYQTITRRLNHPEWIYPQLIIVDGGKPQISAAHKALKEKGLNNQIGLIGIAKRNELIIVPQFKNQEIKKYHLLVRSKRSPVLQLIQAVRDEAHRFAQKYYKTLHTRKLSN